MAIMSMFICIKCRQYTIHSEMTRVGPTTLHINWYRQMSCSHAEGQSRFSTTENILRKYCHMPPPPTINGERRYMGRSSVRCPYFAWHNISSRSGDISAPYSSHESIAEKVLRVRGQRSERVLYWRRHAFRPRDGVDAHLVHVALLL